MDKPFLRLTPNESVDEFWLPLSAFDFSAKAKNGCGGVEMFSQTIFTQFQRVVVQFHVF